MKFFESLQGVHYPVAGITSIGRERERDNGGWKRKLRTVHLEGGDTAEIDSHEFDRLITEDRAFVQAQPGYFLLHRYHDPDGAADTWSEPIIVFYIGRYGSPDAITPNTTIDEIDGRSTLFNATLCPNGQVLAGADGGAWDNQAEWEKYADKEYRVAAALKAKAAASDKSDVD